MPALQTAMSIPPQLSGHLLHHIFAACSGRVTSPGRWADLTGDAAISG